MNIFVSSKTFIISLLFMCLFSTASLSQSIEKRHKLMKDPKLALEIPFALGINKILIEDQLARYVEVNEELSMDLGLGVRFSATDKLKLRLGLHYWKIPINPSYEATATDLNNNSIIINISEDSELNNLSIYIHLTYEGRYTFIGGGANIGVWNGYNTEISYYDDWGNFLFSESGAESLITDKFQNQSHLEAIAGLKFNTKSLGFRPFVKASLPLKALYNSNSPSNTAVDMFAVNFNIGLIVDIGLIKN